MHKNSEKQKIRDQCAINSMVDGAYYFGVSVQRPDGFIARWNKEHEEFVFCWYSRSDEVLPRYKQALHPASGKLSESNFLPYAKINPEYVSPRYLVNFDSFY